MIDRFNGKIVTLTSGVLISIHPFIYTVLPNFYWFILAEFFSGFGWSAYELWAFSYLMSHSDRNTTAEYIANHNFITGITRFIGTNISIVLINFFNITPLFCFTGLTAVILLSGALRIFITLSFIPILKDHGIKLKHDGKRILMLITEFPIKSMTKQIFHHRYYSLHMIRHTTERREKYN